MVGRGFSDLALELGKGLLGGKRLPEPHYHVLGYSRL